MSEFKDDIYEFGEFRVDASKRLLIKGDGESVSLTPKVFDLLLYLVQNSGKVIEKDELMSAIWADTIVEENNLSQNISILRRVLGEKRGEHQFIATIPGRGYKFVAEVKEITDKEEIKENETESETQNTEIKPTENQKPKTENQKSNYLLPVLAISILLITAISFVYFWRQKTVKSPVKTVAVLPFKPLSAETRDDILEIGMADTLIARLGTNPEIVVRPLSSVRRFDNLEQDPLVAGRELGVEAVLDGSIQRVGDKIRVNVRLLKTADGASLWSNTFDKEFTDIFAVQDEISEKVAEALKLQFSDTARKESEKYSTQNVEAYRLYLQGRYYALKSTQPNIRKGIGFYQQAIDADPLYALAYTGMAQAYAALPITSDVPPSEAFPQAKATAQKALEIDADSAEALMILGVVEFWFEWDWKSGETKLKKSIELRPNNPDAHRFYAVLLTMLGRTDEALTEMETARQLDPLSLIVNALEGQTFFYDGREPEAIERLNKTLEIEPDFWVAHINLAKIYINQKNFDEAILEARKAKESSGGNSETVSLLGYALAEANRREEALKTLEELKSAANERYVPPYNIAMIYNGLGEPDETFNWLKKAFQDRDVRLPLIKIDPKWNNLRNAPHFTDLMRRMNFE